MEGPTYRNVADVEADKILYNVMLQTLDPEAEDYEEKRHEYEDKLVRLDRTHADLDPTFRPEHGTSTPPPPSSRLRAPSSDLPSRTRPSLHVRDDGSRSPTRNRLLQNPQQRKRPRELSNATPATIPRSTVSSRKSQRTGLTDDSASTSDSQEEAERALDSATGGFYGSVSRKYSSAALQAQQEAEDRFRRERDDAELARQLSMEQDRQLPPAGPSGSASQAILGSAGNFQQHMRPSAAPLPRNFGSRPTISQLHSPPPVSMRSNGVHATNSLESRGRRPSSEYTSGLPTPPTVPSQSNGNMVRAVNAPNNGGRQPYTNSVSQLQTRPTARSQSSGGGVRAPDLPRPARAQTPGPLHHLYDDSDSDEGLSSITEDEFRHSFNPVARQEQSHGSALAPTWTPWVSGNAVPGAWPDDQAALYPYNRYPSLGYNRPSHYGTTATSSLHAIRGLAGSSVYDSLGLGDPSAARSSKLSAGELSDLRDQAMRSMHDDNDSKEEILKLIDNIRPDEEVPAEQRLDGPPGLKCRLMEHQKLGLSWLRKQEEGPNKGSILADDMGLGKTVQAIALMLARKPTDPSAKTTLIVAPLALMRQWAKEIEAKILSRHALNVFTYHGSKKTGVTWAVLSQYDVVLTTYGTLTWEWTRKNEKAFSERANHRATSSRSRLVLLGDECVWHRVILDEAQVIKNKGTKSALAASNLKAHYRLCMTGTPMMNNVEELFSLIRFLRISPYNVWEKFNKDLLKPIGGRTGFYSRENAMKRLQAVIKAMLLRRTKSSTVDGKPILVLPERVTEVNHAVFDKDQREFYDALEKQSQVTFNKYLKAGTVNKNYTNALVLLLRLRQCCDHPHLIKDHAEKANVRGTEEEQEEIARQFSDETVAMVRASDGVFECPICYDAADNPTIFFPCGHDVCAECFTRLADPAATVATGEESRGTVRCPECRKTIKIDQIISYSVFKRIRLPETCGDADDPGDMDEGIEGSAEEEDDSSDSEDEFDANSEGDLRDFVVPDGEDDDYVHVERPGASKKEKKKNKQGAQNRDNGKGKGRAMPIKAKKKTLADLKREANRSAKGKLRYLRRLRANWVSSAKVDKTMEIIKEIRAKDPHEKTIIFSQFTTFLDLLEVPIDDAGLKWARYDGGMTPLARNEAVDRFEEDRNCNVMLISLKAGNAGLNLNWASQVIILDPFWNPFVEEQAIDRAHRIGQQRPVTVHRILVEETVEDRILVLQEEKRALVSAALDETAGKSLSRLGANHLAYLFGVRAHPNDEHSM